LKNTQRMQSSINEKLLSIVCEEYLKNGNITKSCISACKELDVEYSDSIRRLFSTKLKELGLTNESSTDSNNYKNDKEKKPKGFTAIGDDGYLMPIETYCEFYGLDCSKIRSYKLISHSGIPFYNIVFYSSEEQVLFNLEDSFDEIVKKHIKPIVCEVNETLFEKDEWFDRLVYTDTHIAMDVNGKDGDSLYDGKWDKEEVLTRLDKMVKHVLDYSTSSILVIDDLGDFLDGLGGNTTRKGHELPQNMNDKEAFDLALEFKIHLVDSLMSNYNSIICNNITNDNHSGVFSYFVSQASKKILEAKYPGRVYVNSVKKFIHHYSVGNHTFVISHGKDIGEQKFGFKPKLDAIQAEKIDQYCKEHRLYNGNNIEFSKGDSHQAIYDDTTSNDFSYYNYPAFSPPSNWVKTNFKNSKSGFNFFNISKESNIKISIPYWF
jgi:hypothetical protein